jgi:hypothetical protein
MGGGWGWGRRFQPCGACAYDDRPCHRFYPVMHGTACPAAKGKCIMWSVRITH